MIAVLFTGGLFYTSQYTKSISLGYQINTTKQKITDLQRYNKEMELQVAELQSPKRVETVATTKLGMLKPDNYLLAVLPAEAPSTSMKPQVSLKRESTWSHLVSMTTHHLIQPAEAAHR